MRRELAIISVALVIVENRLARVFTALRSIADARYLSHFGFAPPCAELRSGQILGST